MTKIEELEQKVKELSEEIEWLKNQQKKVVCSRFIPEIGDEYWYVTSIGEIENYNWKITEISQYRLANFPLFRKKSEAERYLEFKQELAKRRWLVTEEEWEDKDTPKYLINIYDNEFNITCTYSTHYVGITYFRTKGDAQYMLDNFKDILRMELI